MTIRNAHVAEPHNSAFLCAPAAIAVLKELKLYERASAGCIAALSEIIAYETGAPDMLAALQAVMAEWREGYGLRCEEQVHAAIAKATRSDASGAP